MARGRKPLPTHLRIVTGNPGKRAINKDEPKAAKGRPSCPAHASDKARETWGYVCGILEDMGILTTTDALAIEMLCEAYADFVAAARTLKDFGSDFYETVNEGGATMYRAHPALAKKQDADRRIRGWLSEFGMSPSSRSRVKLGNNGDEDADGEKKYFA